MLLIHPPVSKPGEPPAGIARLAGALGACHIKHSVIDANLEGQLYLLNVDSVPNDRKSEYAEKNKYINLKAIQTGTAFTSIDHYNRIIGQLNLALKNGADSDISRLDMAEFRQMQLSPTKSRSLIYAAENPAENPFYNYFKNDLLFRIEKKSPAVIGLSVNFLGQAICSFALAGLLKTKFPDVKIIMGGGLITSWMSRYNLLTEFSGIVDEFISGPGEESLITGFSCKSPQKFYQPDYSNLLPEKYFSPVPVLPFSASGGCFWRKCEFCPEKAEGSKYQPLPIPVVLNQIVNLEKEFKPALIHFLDNAMSVKLLAGLIEKPPAADWYGYVRFIEELEDINFCHALKKSGCRMLKLGLESGSQKVLDALQKGINLNAVSKILKNLKNSGISTFVYVLFGTPAESEAEAVKTQEFVRNHADCISFLNPAIFNLPLASREAARLETYALGDDDDLSLYTGFNHPRGWNRRQVRFFLDRVWKRDPEIAAILRRTPRTFTSNHAPFFINKVR